MKIEIIEYKGFKNIRLIEFDESCIEIKSKAGLRDNYMFVTFEGNLIDNPIRDFLDLSNISITFTLKSEKKLKSNLVESQKRKMSNQYMTENLPQYKEKIIKTIKSLIISEIEKYNQPYFDILEDMESYDYQSDYLSEFMETQQHIINQYTMLNDEMNHILEKYNKEMNILAEMSEDINQRISIEKKSILIEEISKNPSKFHIYPEQAGILISKIK